MTFPRSLLLATVASILAVSGCGAGTGGAIPPTDQTVYDSKAGEEVVQVRR